MPDPKPKAPALDQTQAMAVTIPGALPPAPTLDNGGIAPGSGMLSKFTPQPERVLSPGQTEDLTPPPAPMLTDVPIDLPEIIPDAVHDDRPPADALKADWAAWAISRGVPSYEAWAMTLPELKKMEA